MSVSSVAAPRHWGLLLSASLAACGTAAAPEAPRPVEVSGAPRDLRRLVGQWAGQFESDHGDRRGSISFVLPADSDTATGRVTLEAAGACADTAHPRAPQLVAPIRLWFGALATAEGSVGGWMHPYQDPVAACWVKTWFEGRLVRDTLRGTYLSHPEGSNTMREGTWWAARQRR